MPRTRRLDDLSRWPIMVAPMAGGPSTPQLVVAAAEAGAVGFLAAGYKTAAAVAAEIDAVRAITDVPFGVNSSSLSLAPTDRPGRLLASLSPTPPPWASASASRPGTTTPGRPRSTPCAGSPGNRQLHLRLSRPQVVGAFQDHATSVIVTVTTPEEAAVAAAVGADALCVQGFEAGAHRGSFTNDDRPGQDYGLLALITAVLRVTDRPLVAAGGIAGPRSLAAVLAAGAVAAQVGTAFLRCPKPAPTPSTRQRCRVPRYTTTAITRAFSGRRARGLVNQFMLDHPDAPPAYPEINNATRALRAAAIAGGDPDRLSLWAGRALARSRRVPPARSCSNLPPASPRRTGSGDPR